MKMKKFWDWFSTILLGVLVVVFVWSLALSVPIYTRSIYYSQMDQISSESGFDKNMIKSAYDDLLDYLVLHKEFKSGDFTCSEDARSHFADCQRLFDLNLAFLIISAVGIIVLIVLFSKKIVSLKKLGKFNIWFYSAVCMIAIPLILGISAIINFDATFSFLHKVLFPGTDSWFFDYEIDPIIDIFPESYFALCGGIAGGIILIFALGLVISEILLPNLQKKIEKNKKPKSNSI